MFNNCGEMRPSRRSERDSIMEGARNCFTVDHHHTRRCLDVKVNDTASDYIINN